MECEGESIDLSGDMGAVGRIVVPDNNGNCEMYLDLKGMSCSNALFLSLSLFFFLHRGGRIDDD